MKKLLRKFSEAKKVKTENLKASSNKGFTLVELLVAIAVLALVVVPTLSVFVAATKSNSKARTELQATITANSVLESAKAFTIYSIDQQCNTVYTDANASQFTLLAGTTTESFVSSAYGGEVGTVIFDSNDNVTIESVGKRNASITFSERAEKYAYYISGIKQSNSTYDAVIIFDELDYQDVEIDGSVITESDIQGIYDDYNKKYAIKIYVYKHSDSPAFIGKDPANDENVLVKIEGSKVDRAAMPN